MMSLQENPSRIHPFSIFESWDQHEPESRRVGDLEQRRSFGRLKSGRSPELTNYKLVIGPTTRLGASSTFFPLAVHLVKAYGGIVFPGYYCQVSSVLCTDSSLVLSVYVHTNCDEKEATSLS